MSIIFHLTTFGIIFKEKMIPVPDFDEESDEDFSDTCNAIDAPEPLSEQCGSTFSAKVARVHDKFHPFELFCLSRSCNPDTTFSSKTSNGIEYDIDHPIYKTKSCTLFLGRRQNDYYALKTSQASNILMREWENYTAIGKYPTIINAVNILKETNKGSFCSITNYYLQLEYAFGGSISNYIKLIDYKEAWKVLAHISSALDYIHKKGFIHLDISPSNILKCYINRPVNDDSKSSFDVEEKIFERSSLYKLADFGTVIKEGCCHNFCEGAGPYVSPEALKWPNSGNPITSKTDIWSLGAVMFEIVTHKKIPRDAKRYDDIRAGRIDLTPLIPEEFEIIKQMLRADPSARPSAEQLMQLPKVKDILQSLEEDLNFNEEINKLKEDAIEMNIPKTKWAQTFPIKSFRRQSFDLI